MDEREAMDMLPESSLTGKHRFRNVLYKESYYQSDEEYSSNTLISSDTPPIEKAKADANEKTSETGVPHVACAVSMMGRNFNGDYTYEVVPFYSINVAREKTPEFRKALQGAFNSDEYEVSVETNYRTGSVVINVKKA